MSRHTQLYSDMIFTGSNSGYLCPVAFNIDLTASTDTSVYAVTFNVDMAELTHNI